LHRFVDAGKDNAGWLLQMVDIAAPALSAFWSGSWSDWRSFNVEWTRIDMDVQATML
jgi:hypothetical protein